MVTQVSQIISEAQAKARQAANAARNAIGLGVVTAVDPTTQTISVRRRDASTPANARPIDGVIPFQVETPIKPDAPDDPSIVRLFKHGGVHYAAPIEESLAARVGKDTRFGYMDKTLRVIDFDGDDLLTVAAARTLSPTGADDDMVLFSNDAARAFTTGRSFTQSRPVTNFFPRTPITLTRTLTTLVDTPTDELIELGGVGDGSAHVFVAGDGLMLPSYCYDLRAAVDRIQVGYAGPQPIDAFVSEGDNELHWLLNPPSDYPNAIFGLFPVTAPLIINYGFQVTLPTGASVRAVWYPDTDDEEADSKRDGGVFDRSRSDIQTKAHLLISQGAAGTLRGYVAARVRAQSVTGYIRQYDIIMMDGDSDLFTANARGLRPIDRLDDLADSWHEWRESNA